MLVRANTLPVMSTSVMHGICGIWIRLCVMARVAFIGSSHWCEWIPDSVLVGLAIHVTFLSTTWYEFTRGHCRVIIDTYLWYFVFSFKGAFVDQQCQCQAQAMISNFFPAASSFTIFRTSSARLEFNVKLWKWKRVCTCGLEITMSRIWKI